MQNSVRCVLPVRSASRWRNTRSTSHGARRVAARRHLARTRSRARGANRCVLRPRADADSSGRRRAPRTGTTATGDCASSRAGCGADRAGAGTDCRPASRPPSTMWLPPPVPVCRPSSRNFSVPSRVLSAPRRRASRSARRSPASWCAGCMLTSMTPGSGVTLRWLSRGSCSGGVPSMMTGISSRAAVRSTAAISSM